MAGKTPHVLLGVTGSVAAVKAPDLVRRLMDKGFDVSCVMTSAAKHFVTELALAAFSKRPVISDMFGPDAYKMPHLALAAEADVMVIAPASASMLGCCAQGLADDMVSLSYITTTAPTLMVPAMHNTMWEHAAVQENVRLLKSRGVTFVGPYVGPLADQTQGEGRMSDPSEVVLAVEKILAAKK